MVICLFKKPSFHCDEEWRGRTEALAFRDGQMAQAGHHRCAGLMFTDVVDSLFVLLMGLIIPTDRAEAPVRGAGATRVLIAFMQLLLKMNQSGLTPRF